MMRTTTTTTADRERGAALIIVALSLVSLMAVAGLIIDGGRVYSERRQMQNASDSAAMAGARELDLIRTELQQTPPGAVDADDIYEAALDAAEDNGADPGTDFECYIVAEGGSYVTGSAATSVCPPDDGVPSPLPGGLLAAGVEIATRSSQETFFARVGGTESFQARAGATAQVQGLRAVESYATPFMICAFDRGADEGDIQLLRPAGTTWELNPDALWSAGGANTTGESELDGMGGPWFKIHGPHVPNCGLDAETWKGLVDPPGDFSVPGVWQGNNGNKAGPTRSLVTSDLGCSGDDDDDYSDGCLILAPVCLRHGDYPTEISDDRTDLYCVTFGTFKVVKTHSNEHHAALLGDATIITEGEGGGAPDLNEPRVIKLTK
jgi:hypothetical protein